MSKRSAIITGAAKRIGKYIALSLAKRGYDIGLHYYTSQNDALETKKEIETIGRDCVLLRCDLQNEKEAEKLISNASESLKNVELLVNNASIFEQKDFDKTSAEDIERNFAVHLKAPFILSSRFAAHCKHGNIINIVDANIVKTETDYFAYLLSKRALMDLTVLTAKALAPNIRVNAIAPGSTIEPIDWNKKSYSYVHERATQVPLKTEGGPQYIMQGIDYLISNAIVTGQCLFIDSGAHIEY